MAKAATLVDNFDDNVTDPTLWAVTVSVGPTAERLREVNGRLELRPPGTIGYARYESVAAYDLEDSFTGVEVVQTLRQAQGAGTQFAAVTSAGLVGFTQTRTHITLYKYVGPTYVGMQTVQYDPTAHRWWRLREAQGTTFWETSPDNATWTVQYSEPTPFSLAAVNIRLEASVAGTPVASPGVTIFENVGLADTSRARRIEERRRSARDVRVEAAALAEARLHDEHANNNDEANYPTRPLAGSYSKSLKHDALGDPDPASYATLLRALQSRDPDDFEEVQLASGTALKLTNPQAGLTFDIGGPDPQERTLPPAPRFDSEVAAHEMGELYWMALARDVHFSTYGADATVAAAITSLNNEFPRHGGTTPVTAANVFRGVYAGEQVGPYVSQFLLKGNTDTRKPDGLGRDANEGYVSLRRAGERPADHPRDGERGLPDDVPGVAGRAERGGQARAGLVRDDAPLHPQPARRGHVRALRPGDQRVLQRGAPADDGAHGQPARPAGGRHGAAAGGPGVRHGPRQSVQPAGHRAGLAHAGGLRDLRAHPPAGGAGRGAGAVAAGRLVAEVGRAPAAAAGGVRRARAQPGAVQPERRRAGAQLSRCTPASPPRCRRAAWHPTSARRASAFPTRTCCRRRIPRARPRTRRTARGTPRARERASPSSRRSSTRTPSSRTPSRPARTGCLSSPTRARTRRR